MSLAAEVDALAGRVADEFNDLRSGTITDIKEKMGYQSFTYQGAISTYVGKCRFYVPWSCTIASARLSLGTAGSSTTTIDINKGGSTIWSTQGNRLSLTSGNQNTTTTSFDTSSLVYGEYLTVDIDAAGTGATDMVVQIRFVVT